MTVFFVEFNKIGSLINRVESKVSEIHFFVKEAPLSPIKLKIGKKEINEGHYFNIFNLLKL